MRRFFLLMTASVIFQASSASALTLREFIKNCAWGTGVGAGLGVVSMAVSDKPGESWGNVAKGASLGLYAGIGYSIYRASVSETPNDAYPEYRTEDKSDFSMAPQFKNGKVEGVQLSGTLYSF